MRLKIAALWCCVLVTVLKPGLQAAESDARPAFDQAVADFQRAPIYDSLFRVIALVAKLDTPPVIPEEARRNFVQGVTILKESKDADTAAQAAELFVQAAFLAPWWPEARYNCALAQEAAGKYDLAIAALKAYLQFNLPAEEVRAAQDKIYSIEAKQQAEVRKMAKYQKDIGFLAGHWKRSWDGADDGFWNIIIDGKEIKVMNDDKFVYLIGYVKGEDYRSIQWTQPATLMNISGSSRKITLPAIEIAVSIDPASGIMRYDFPGFYRDRDFVFLRWNLEDSSKIVIHLR